QPVAPSHRKQQRSPCPSPDSSPSAPSATSPTAPGSATRKPPPRIRNVTRARALPRTATRSWSASRSTFPSPCAPPRTQAAASAKSEDGTVMRLLVLLTALAMPVVAWMSNTGAFGPDQGEISGRYPTLLVAAGYAFSIWGLIFLLDVLYAGWQMTGERKRDDTLARIAPWAAGGFFLTTIWMPLFSQELFWLCLAVIFVALACLAY